jgi:hypothetical protein
VVLPNVRPSRGHLRSQYVAVQIDSLGDLGLLCHAKIAMIRESRIAGSTLRVGADWMQFIRQVHSIVSALKVASAHPTAGVAYGRRDGWTEETLTC